jgi:hypothetical protein
MTFHSDKYKIVRNSISVELSKFVSDYLLLKKQVHESLKPQWYKFPPNLFGMDGDPQCPNAYTNYGDIATDTLLTTIQPKMEEETGLKLYPTYTYSRIYKNGAILHRHRDRPSCEISATLNLSGDPWSIYLEPDIEVKLTPGDMLIYSGTELEHWRNRFQGDTCIQVFLHYQSTDENIYDNRLHLGIPSGM